MPLSGVCSIPPPTPLPSTEAKNPLLALRTFAMLLLRRLPGDASDSIGEDSLVRELARDIVVQSDRLGDLFGPMESLVGALGLISEAVPPTCLPPDLAMALLTDSAADAADTNGVTSNLEYVPMLSLSRPSTTLTAGKRSGGEDGIRPTTTLRPREINVPLFVDEIVIPLVHAARAIAERESIVLHLIAPPQGELPGGAGEERALREAVANVLDNALKYVRAGGVGGAGSPEVTLTLMSKSKPGEEGVITVEVCDNGPGVPAHELPRLFERGYRGSGGHGPGGVAGSGLGLSIARELITACGGDLALELRSFEQGGGTCVTITIPRYV